MTSEDTPKAAGSAGDKPPAAPMRVTGENGPLDGESTADGNCVRALAGWLEVLARTGTSRQDQAKAIQAVREAAEIAPTLKDTRRTHDLLVSASNVLEWLRENGTLSEEVDRLRPRLREQFRKLDEALKSAAELDASRQQVERLRLQHEQEPENRDRSRHLLAMLGTTGQLSVAQGSYAAAADIYEEAFALWAILVAQGQPPPEDHEVMLGIIRIVTDQQAAYPWVSLPGEGRAKKFLAAVVDAIQKIQGNGKLSPELLNASMYLDGMLLQLASRVPPRLPPQLVELLLRLNVHDVAWQAAYWNVQCEKDADLEQARQNFSSQQASLVNRGVAADMVLAHVWKLPFYRKLCLALLIPRDADAEALSGVQRHAWLLLGGQSSLWLNGAVDPIKIANAEEQLDLKPGEVRAYLKFFCFFVRANNEPFTVLDRLARSIVPELTDENLRSLHYRGMNWRLLPKTRAQGNHGAVATVLYAHQLFRATFQVSTSGEVRMEDDKPVSVDGEEKSE